MDQNEKETNTRDRNTGNWNTGKCNTGNRNTGNWNTGYCNTITPETCLIFNKPGKRQDWFNADKPSWMYVSLTDWVPKSEMSEKEKEAYPSYTTTGGYLKVYSSLQHAYIEAWGKATEEDKAKTFKLPNFDVDVFIEIFGFDPREDKKTITIDGKDIKISTEKFEELKKQLLEE